MARDFSQEALDILSELEPSPPQAPKKAKAQVPLAMPKAQATADQDFSKQASDLLAELEPQEGPKTGFTETQQSKSARENVESWKKMALPMLGTAAGAFAGPYAGAALGFSKMLPFIVGGEMLGGGAGEAVNQATGITEPSKTNLAINTLAPVAGRAVAGAIQYAPRLLPNSVYAIRAGLADRGRAVPDLIKIPEASEALYNKIPKAGEPGSFRITEMPSTQRSIAALRSEMANPTEPLGTAEYGSKIRPLIESVEEILNGPPVTYRTIEAKLPTRTVDYQTQTAKLPEQNYSQETAKATFHGPEGTQTIRATLPEEEQLGRTIKTTLPKEGVDYRTVTARLPVAPSRAPGYEFEEAIKLSRGLGNMIRSTPDSSLRGAYRSLYRSVLEDLERLPMPAGQAVETWNKSRAAYKRELAKDQLTEAVEKSIAPKEGIEQFNADAVLKFVQKDKEFRKRLEPADLAGLEKELKNLASYTGKRSNKLLTIIAGTWLGGGAGGAAAGYVTADVMASALMQPGARKLLTKLVTMNEGRAGQDAGAILAAGLAGALGNDPEEK